MGNTAFTRTKYYVRNPKLVGNARSCVLMHALAFSTANHRRTSTNVGLSKPNVGLSKPNATLQYNMI